MQCVSLKTQSVILSLPKCVGEATVAIRCHKQVKGPL